MSDRVAGRITQGLIEAERMGWDRIMLSWGEWSELVDEITKSEDGWQSMGDVPSHYRSIKVEIDPLDAAISQVLAEPVHEYCPACGLRNPYCGCV